MPVLSRVQQNDIFEMAKRHGLDPLDFEWSSTEQYRYRGLTEILTHRFTQSRFDFSRGTQGGVYMSWWPQFAGGPTEGNFSAVWERALRLIDEWLAEVKRNADAPDLWTEAAKAREITDAAGHVDAENTPFDPSEVELLKPRLDEIQAFIESKQPLDNAQQKRLRGQFAYLFGAAKRGIGRVDWLNIFVAQIIQLTIGGIIHPSFYSEVMRYANAVLGSVWRFGSRLLGP